MIIVPSQLDPDSLEYLRHIEKTRGKGSNGVFARAPSRAGPRDGWMLLSFLGLGALGGAALLARPSFLEGRNLFPIVCAQAGLVAAGVLLLGLGLRRLARTSLLGTFVYMDALHSWEVSPRRVEFHSLEELVSVDGSHHYLEDGYTSSEIVLHLRSGDQSLIVYDMATAERLVRFADLLISLRDAEDEDLRVRLRLSPALLGAAALRLADEEPVEDLASLPEGPPLLRPTERLPADGPARVGSLRRAAAPWLAAVAAGGLALLFFSLLDRYLLDEHLWALARQEADERDSPSRLRIYLADPGNRRHRSEAQERINIFYDEVLANLKQRRARHDDPEHPIDQQMFTAVLELIEALKTTDRPVVTVGFQSSQDTEPGTEEEKLGEKMVYEERLKEHPALKEVARKSPDKTAILTRGQTFDAEQTRRREEVILARLRDSVQKALGADILTLERAADGEKPILEVDYHVHPAGRLYVYIFGKEERPIGLIRGYVIDWKITIRPPGRDKEHECRLGSQPATKLHYDADNGDPSWAPYAIVLYSAFDDLSSRLVRNFALTPPKAPERYRFKAVAGDAADR